jgi:CRISPR-associated protein Csb2
MLSLEIELLTGHYGATVYNDRSQAEWPPHPARLYSALVSAMYEGAEPVEPAERAALLWLEAQPAPDIVCSVAAQREQGKVYVPVNDESLLGNMDDEAAALDRANDDLKLGRVQGATAKRLDKLQKDLNKVLQKIEAQCRASAKPSDAEVVLVPKLLFAERRHKVERTFPVASPSEPRVWFVWPNASWGEHQEALGRLAGRMSRLGHSSSLVRLAWSEQAPTSWSREGAPSASHLQTWTPDPEGREMLRTVEAGQLDALDREFAFHKATEPRILPARLLPYRIAAPSAPQVPVGAFDAAWIGLQQVEGPPSSARAAPALARAVRAALGSYTDEGGREFVSGLDAERRPTRAPHLAFVPLMDVGHQHARGHALGVALVFPRAPSEPEAQAQRHAAEGYVKQALQRWEAAGAAQDEDGLDDPLQAKLWVEFGGVRRAFRRVLGQASAKAMWPKRWSGPSREWVSATPVALDEFIGELRSRRPEVAQAAAQRAAQSITRACQRQGLPAPVWVEVGRAPFLRGALSVEQHAPFSPAPQGDPKMCVHVALRFSEPVAGPLLLGAGRFLGVGLMFPLASEELG